MPYVKFTTGHTDCSAIHRYLEKGGRALATDYLNLDAPVVGVSSGHEDYGEFDWAAVMDETRHAFGNDAPWHGKAARTFKHYMVSPDPDDNMDLPALRRLAKQWAKENFGDYEVAIVYHDDNENGVLHAHVVVNNTNMATGYRLQEPDPRSFRNSLRKIAIEQGLKHFGDERGERRQGSATNPATWQRRYERRAEAELESKGKYSWVADIRCRVEIAKAVAKGQAEYTTVLNAMGVEVSDNSSKADRRDFVYSLADHPNWKIRGERLGLDYGRYSVERGFSIHGLDRASERRAVRIARNAVDVGGLGELRQLSSFVSTCERYAARSLNDLEDARRIAPPDEIKLLDQALDYARSHDVIPVETVQTKPHGSPGGAKPWEKHPWKEREPKQEAARQQHRQQAQSRMQRERNEHDR